MARGINRLHLTAPDAKNQGMEICQNILNGNDRYSSSDILQSFNEINQVGDIYLGVQMVRFLLTSLSRPQQQLSEILSIIIPLFQTNHTWGLEGMLCLSTLCLENSPKLQKAILKLLEKALKDENDNCRFGATIALDIIGSLADGGVAAFARRLLTEIEIPSRGQHIGRSSRLFMIASTRILEIRRERKGVDESMLKYLQIKKRQ